MHWPLSLKTACRRVRQAMLSTTQSKFKKLYHQNNHLSIAAMRLRRERECMF